MKYKDNNRLRRARKTRARIQSLEQIRLCVYRTPRHFYAQVIASDARVLTSASTVEPEMRKSLRNGGNIAASEAIGKRIAEKSKGLGIETVAFDRSGFRYHGRIKAFADAARNNGLKI